MNLRWNRKESWFDIGGEAFKCSCLVRNEENGRRKPSEIVYSMPDGHPYQPRPFPAGTWKIGKPEPKSDAWLRPWFIPTNAFQILPVWEIRNGLYVRPTSEMITDIGYGFHFSETSKTTWGCCRLGSRAGIERLKDIVFEAIQDGEEIIAEVI